MTERNGADVVREYMASSSNPMRALIKEWRKVPNHRKDSDLRADELEAALADTGELVSRINYYVETSHTPQDGQRFELAPTFDLKAAYDEFEAYFVTNYPGPYTIIHRPKWHAPKIWKAALAALKPHVAVATQAASTEGCEK